MGGVCECCPWSCRPLWSLLIVLAALPSALRCSDSPAAAAAGKMYPRGNHWAVGHLMGKKSIESLQETNRDSDHLPPSHTAGVTERRVEAVVQQKEQEQEQTKPQTPDGLLRLLWLLRLHGSWRDGYLREMSELLLLALKLRDNDST